MSAVAWTWGGVGQVGADWCYLQRWPPRRAWERLWRLGASFIHVLSVLLKCLPSWAEDQSCFPGCTGARWVCCPWHLPWKGQAPKGEPCRRASHLLCVILEDPDPHPIPS